MTTKLIISLIVLLLIPISLAHADQNRETIVGWLWYGWDDKIQTLDVIIPPEDKPTTPIEDTPITKPVKPAPPITSSSCEVHVSMPFYQNPNDTKEYQDGYEDGYEDNNYRPRNVDEDYMKGYDDGYNDKLDGKPNKFRDTTSSFVKDCDPKTKGGGQDPLIIGSDWWYLENSAAKCKPANLASFDYDNDNVSEYMCYNPVGGEGLLTIDFRDGEGISHGYNILNFHRTTYDGMTPVEFLEKYPFTCIYYDCYLWKDNNLNWKAEQKELTSYTPVITQYIDMPLDENKKCTYHDNNRCIYGKGTFSDGKEFFALQPTFIWNISDD